jgi:hypothetical protein
MFLELTQNNCENHNFVGTIGNTIYKEWGGLFATGYDVPNNSWDYADIALTTGFEAKQMTLMYMTKEDFLILVECNTITREISIVSNVKT